HQVDRNVHVSDRRHHAFGHPIAAVDPGEDVHENGAHVLVGQDEAECCRHSVGARPATDVEEVGWLAPGVLDHVHRGHGQAGAIDDAADVAFQCDVIQAVFRGL